MSELNLELQRCHMCGAHLPDLELFFCPGDPRFDTPDGLSLCESAYLRRVEAGYPVPSFRPWPEERLRREAMLAATRGGSWSGRTPKGKVCALPGCEEPVTGRQTFHAEKCRAAMYRLRKRGG